jgi:hypothetical protein
MSLSFFQKKKKKIYVTETVQTKKWSCWYTIYTSTYDYTSNAIEKLPTKLENITFSNLNKSA